MAFVEQKLNADFKCRYYENDQAKTLSITMKSLSIGAILFASLEVFLSAALVFQALFVSGWWLLGAIVYQAILVRLSGWSGAIWSLGLGSLLSFAYLFFGAFGAILSFILAIFLGEIFMKKQANRPE